MERTAKPEELQILCLRRIDNLGRVDIGDENRGVLSGDSSPACFNGDCWTSMSIRFASPETIVNLFH